MIRDTKYWKRIMKKKKKGKADEAKKKKIDIGSGASRNSIESGIRKAKKAAKAKKKKILMSGVTSERKERSMMPKRK